MIIVNIEDFFHPDAGYQINILSKYMVYEGHEVYIVTSELDRVPDYLTRFFGKDDIDKKDQVFEIKTGVHIIRLPIKRYISGRAIYYNSIMKIIDSLHPDIIYVHGNDTYIGMRYLLHARRYKGRLVSDSHMLEMASTNKFNVLFRFFYRHCITPIIIKNQIPIIRTQDSEYVSKCLGIPLQQAPYISVGTDVKMFSPNDKIKKQFREKYNIDEKDFVVVYTGKLDESKGGMLLAKAFQEKFVGRNVTLLVIGNSIGEYGRQVDNLLEKSKNNILRFPTQPYVKLPLFYQAADLSVFPKQCSLSFFDAQACGLPVVSEKNEINQERCSHHNGFNFINDDVEDFRRKIQMCLDMRPEEFKKMAYDAHVYISDNFNYESIAKEYLHVIDGVKRYV